MGSLIGYRLRFIPGFSFVTSRYRIKATIDEPVYVRA